MYQSNVGILNETLESFKKGYYEKDGRRINLHLSSGEFCMAEVLLPQEIDKIDTTSIPVNANGQTCQYSCENEDSLHAAMRMKEGLQKEDKLLVLNFANPIHPGGGVRNGANAQEEDLCRKSSLLFSLESDGAKKYYEYNRTLHTYLASDAMILSPKVEIIRNQNGEFLDEPITISVLTCAAPMVIYGIEGLTQQQYQDMLFQRIWAILKVSLSYGYPNIILGAWGCGAFGNDAALVSDLFYRAFYEHKEDGFCMNDYFQRVTFAVLDRSTILYNYKQFSERFHQ